MLHSLASDSRRRRMRLSCCVFSVARYSASSSRRRSSVMDGMGVMLPPSPQGAPIPDAPPSSAAATLPPQPPHVAQALPWRVSGTRVAALGCGRLWRLSVWVSSPPRLRLVLALLSRLFSFLALRLKPINCSVSQIAELIRKPKIWPALTGHNIRVLFDNLDAPLWMVEPTTLNPHRVWSSRTDCLYHASAVVRLIVFRYDYR